MIWNSCVLFSKYGWSHISEYFTLLLFIVFNQLMKQVFWMLDISMSSDYQPHPEFYCCCLRQQFASYKYGLWWDFYCCSGFAFICSFPSLMFTVIYIDIDRWDRIVTASTETITVYNMCTWYYYVWRSTFDDNVPHQTQHGLFSPVSHQIQLDQRSSMSWIAPGSCVHAFS